MIVVFFLLFSLDDSFFMQWYNCSNVWLLQRQKKNWSFLSEKKEFLIKRSHPKFGNISQMLDPPPPFRNPCFQQKKCCLFFILGPQEHFWSSQKCSLFGHYPETSCFRWFFSRMFQFLNQDQAIKFIRYHLPTIVKQVLAPKNDFGIPKKCWWICLLRQKKNLLKEYTYQH